jgi:hypothetical protein
MAKRTVTFEGRTYKVRSDSVEIPDFETMSAIGALVWINRHTYPRGYSRATQPLAGLGDALSVVTR